MEHPPWMSRCISYWNWKFSKVMLVFRAVFPPEKWGEPYNSWVTIPKTNSEFTPWKMMVWRLLSLWEEPLWRVVYKPLLQALKRIIPAIWKKNMGVYNPTAHMGKRADRKKNLWNLQIFDQKNAFRLGKPQFETFSDLVLCWDLDISDLSKVVPSCDVTRNQESQMAMDLSSSWCTTIVYVYIDISIYIYIFIYVYIYTYTRDIQNRVEF